MHLRKMLKSRKSEDSLGVHWCLEPLSYGFLEQHCSAYLVRQLLDSMDQLLSHVIIYSLLPKILHVIFCQRIFESLWRCGRCFVVTIFLHRTLTLNICSVVPFPQWNPACSFAMISSAWGISLIRRIFNTTCMIDHTAAGLHGSNSYPYLLIVAQNASCHTLSTDFFLIPWRCGRSFVGISSTFHPEIEYLFCSASSMARFSLFFSNDFFYLGY